MKRTILLIVSFFVLNVVLAQEKMILTLKNGEKKEGVYKIKLPQYGLSAFKIVGHKNREKYGLKDIDKVLIIKDSNKYWFEVIDTKKYVDSKKSKLKFGQVIYKGKHISVFETVETIYSGSVGGGFIVQSNSNYQNSYAKKTNDTYAFNIGYIYGAAQKGIKKRIRSYFSECPSLVSAVENKLIDKKDVKSIVLFYENNCSH